VTIDETRSDWLAVVLLYACGLAAAMQLGAVPPIMPALITELGFSVAQAGWAASLVNLLGVPFSLAAGTLGMRFGLRRTLVAGLVIMATGSVLSAGAVGPWLFLAARTVTGLGYLAVVVVAPTLMVLACAPRQRALATGLWGTFVSVGIALGATVSGRADDWRMAFLLLAVPAIALAIGAAMRVSALTPSQPVVSHHAPAPRGRGLAFAMGFGCYSASVLSVLSLLPLFLDRTAGWTATQTGSATGMVALAAVPGSLLAGWLIARGVGFGIVAIVPLVLSGLSGAAIFAWGGGTQAVALACVGQVFAGLMSGGAFSMVPKVAGSPDRLARINGLLAQFGNLGSLIGPPIAGFVAAGYGWPAVGLVTLCFVAGATLLLLVGVRGRTDEASPSERRP
jgi:MFS transporter, CP family, cyanate transporter